MVTTDASQDVRLATPIYSIKSNGNFYGFSGFKACLLKIYTGTSKQVWNEGFIAQAKSDKPEELQFSIA